MRLMLRSRIREQVPTRDCRVLAACAKDAASEAAELVAKETVAATASALEKKLLLAKVTRDYTLHAIIRLCHC